MELDKTQRINSVSDAPNRSRSDAYSEEGQSDDKPREHIYRSNYNSLSEEEAVHFGGALSSALSSNTANLFSAFVAEMEPIRAEVARLKKRKEFYKEMSVKHAFLPIPNRRQFLLEAEHYLHQRQGLKSRPISLLIHIGGLAKFRKHHGRQAADLFLKYTTELLLSVLQSGDILGNYGGEDFAAMLSSISRVKTHTRINQINMDLNRNPFLWQGIEYPLDAVFGWEQLIDNLTLDEAFELADQTIRKKLSNDIGV